MTPEAEGVFAGAGGVAIHWERFAPAGAPRGVVLLSHGYAEHVGRYRETIAHFLGRGLAVAALDHRGHGRSGGPRGHAGDFAEFVADLRTLADAAGERWPGVPRVLLGHSMGGLVALLYVLAHPDTVCAGIVIAPALRVPEGTSSWPRWLGRVLARVAPRAGVRTNVDETALSRDPAVGRAYAADPLVHRRATAALGRALGAAQAAARAGAARLRVPLLVLQGDADRVVDPAGTYELAAHLAGPHELIVLPGYYHEVLNEPPAERARAIAAIDAWIDRFLPAARCASPEPVL